MTSRPGPDMMLERACPAPVCGVDEAGRGPWAGPVAAAAVILRPRTRIAGLDDSKKLSPARREALAPVIKARALAWAVGFASVEEIAALNILHATGLAMRRAVEALGLTPVFALVDGNYRFPLPCPVKTVVGGDGISSSIAAASILAKTARDALMAAMDGAYPGYGFAAHKGYGAPAHARALWELGPCEIHRLGWAPVRLAIAGRYPSPPSPSWGGWPEGPGGAVGGQSPDLVIVPDCPTLAASRPVPPQKGWEAREA